MTDTPATDAENETLARACEAVADAASAGVEWVGLAATEVREEGPAMARELRRGAIRARKLAEAARRPMCVSVFGPSQSGKSYLISALARKEQRPAKVIFAGQELDIVRDINPEGGKEATGLVTRFSIRPTPSLPGLPVAMRLLSQTDIVRIIANAFMEDFNRDTVVPLTREQVEAVMGRLRGKARPAPVDVLTEDDMQELFEYFERYFRNHPTHVALTPAPWREMESLAPRLPIAERAELFGLLWNNVPELTQLCARLMTALAELDFAGEAFCALDAMVPKARSVIDVATLFNLGKDESDRVAIGTRSGRRAQMARPVITAIVAELQLQLAEKPFDFFDHTDLLDFPGARSRERYDGRDAEKTAAANLYHLFIRGKVAYLYQRYLAEQELTSMLLCLGDSNQEVRTLPAMVKDWIDGTHGATAEARSAHADPALFLVFTKFDKEFVAKAGADDDNVERWSTRLDTTIKSFLALDYDWPYQWKPGQPFNNTFWLRNPNAYDEGLLDYAAPDADRNRREIAFRSQPRLAMLRARFLENVEVRRFFADPAMAWDEAMTLNDGGLGYIARRLRPVCNPETKRRQVRALLASQAQGLAGSLRPYYVSSDLEAELQKRLGEARTVVAVLNETARRQAFGLFLHEMQVNADRLAEVFRARQLNVSDLPSAVAGPVGTTLDVADLDDELADIFGDTPTPKPAPREQARDLAEVFAEAALAHWHEGLHALASREDLEPLFGLTREALASLTGQLGAASRRVGLRARIAQAIRGSASYHEKVGERLLKPVMIAERMINDFVYWLDMDKLKPEARPTAGRPTPRPVFTRPPAAEQWPDLAERAQPFERDFYVDWAVSYRRLVEENARVASGMVGDVALNEKLGRILAALR
ncbi:virulence factor SrfC family protein [Sediminicoccus sp. KRV36]|uniref:virulence factor SrfC family protein n=1 Tax=Sediminicoccus sp. KRV36 TaxID=3133721 RepID=UPI00200D34DA|nr:virulence factor SrfC family protein [Sediminicoccus rosea]UPY38940.1 putative virulence factor [Sediminicoccus rosea]